MAAAFDYLLSTISAASLRRPEDRRGATFWGLGAIGGSLVHPNCPESESVRAFQGDRMREICPRSCVEVVQFGRNGHMIPHEHLTSYIPLS